MRALHRCGRVASSERDAVEIVAYGLAVISASQAVFDDLGYLIESLKATERADKKKMRLVDVTETSRSLCNSSKARV